MRNLPVILVTLFSLVSSGFAADRRDREKECEEVKERIRDIQARMRRGYSAAQGIRLNEKLLDLRERRSKVCR